MIDEQRLLEVIEHLRKAIGYLAVHNNQAAHRQITDSYDKFRALRAEADKPKGE